MYKASYLNITLCRWLIGNAFCWPFVIWFAVGLVTAAEVHEYIFRGFNLFILIPPEIWTLLVSVNDENFKQCCYEPHLL